MSDRMGPAADKASAVSSAIAIPRYRRVAVAVAAVFLLTYLFSIRNVLVLPGTDFGRFVDLPSVLVAPDWTSKVLRQEAPFYYEPVVAVYVTSHVALFVSPVNVAMGLLLGGLVGANVAVALLMVRAAKACRRRAFGGLLGAIPGFLTGFTCCVPSIALVLGSQFALALAVRSYFFPFAVVASVLSLVLNARRMRGLAPGEPATAR